MQLFIFSALNYFLDNDILIISMTNPVTIRYLSILMVAQPSVASNHFSQ